MVNWLLLFSIAIYSSSTTWRNNKLLAFPFAVSLSLSLSACILVHFAFVGVTGGQILWVKMTTTSLQKTWTVLKSLLFNFEIDLLFEFPILQWISTATQNIEFSIDNFSSGNLNRNHYRNFANEPVGRFMRWIGFFLLEFLQTTKRRLDVHIASIYWEIMFLHIINPNDPIELWIMMFDDWQFR